MLKHLIAAIDDELINLKLIEAVLKDDYEIKTFISPQMFLNAFDEGLKPDLILLDIVMSEKSGYDVLNIIKKRHNGGVDIPVIFLTSKTSEQEESVGYEHGAQDYVTKPFSPIILKHRINVLLQLKDAQTQLQKRNEILNEEVEKRVKEIQLTQDLTLSVMAQIVEKRDSDTGQHILRTQYYFKTIATYLKNSKNYQELTDNDIRRMSKASMLHDVGKVGVPDHILNKPGRLTDEERQVMQKHCQYGKEALESALQLVSSDHSYDMDQTIHMKAFLKDAIDITYGHHEKWDGTGYPQGLKGELIPLSARIMAIADVFDALITKRVYKEAWTPENAIELILSEKGKHFDPVIVDAFDHIKDHLVHIYETYKDNE